MNKFKTTAFEVKSDLEQPLDGADIFNTPWDFIDYNMEARVLEATENELKSIYSAMEQ